MYNAIVVMHTWLRLFVATPYNRPLNVAVVTLFSAISCVDRFEYATSKVFHHHLIYVCVVNQTRD